MPIITFSEFFGAIARLIIAAAVMLAPFAIDAAIDACLENSLPPTYENR